MPTTEAFSAQQSYISIGDSASPNTFTEVAEVKNIGGPNETADEIEVTHLRSPGSYREFLASFKDGGEIPCVANYIPSNATHGSGASGLRGLFASGAVRGWRITLADGTLLEFDGWVKAIGTPIQVGNAVELNFTVRVSGAVVATEAA